MLWAAAGALELPLLAAMAGAPARPPWWLCALLHAGAAALVFFAPPEGPGWREPARHWGRPLAALTLLAPVAGWAAAGWAYLKHADAPRAREAGHDEELAAAVDPFAEVGTADAIRRELEAALDVVPAVDALFSSSVDVKRGALEALSRIRTQEAIGWIIRARSDPDPEARFYATTALTRLKRDYETAVKAAEQQSYRRPGDPEAQLALYRIRYEYAASGLLEGVPRRAVLLECAARLITLADRLPEAARLLFLVEREVAPERAAGTLDRLEAADPGRAVLWLRERARLLFELRRYGELARLLRARGAGVAAEDDASPEAAAWRSSQLWWTG